MTVHDLAPVAWQLVAHDKGLLAIDESKPTCNARFAALGIAQSAKKRRAWRQLIVTTSELSQFISGIILCDETIRQTLTDDTPFAHAIADADMIPGIKVDMGLTELAHHPHEKVTEGLDGLRSRLEKYAGMGAKFAKWRSVIRVDGHLPSEQLKLPYPKNAIGHATIRYPSESAGYFIILWRPFLSRLTP